MATPYMSLSLPSVGVTPGPSWASMISAALTAVDSHSHVPGSGVAIPAAALNINADVGWGGFNLTALRTARFQNLGSPPALGTDIACLGVSGGNLYYVNASGQQVQITAGAALNAASIGAIGGDYSTSTASEVYVSASQTFQFFQAANKYANLDAGNVILREPGATSPQGITLKSPASLAASYALTLPAALPAATKILTLSAAGAIAAVYDVDGATLEVASNALRVKDAGITGAKIAGSTITAANIASGTITGANLANNTVTGTQIASNAIGTSQLALGAVGAANLAAGFYANVLLIGRATLDGSGNVTISNANITTLSAAVANTTSGGGSYPLACAPGTGSVVISGGAGAAGLGVSYFIRY